MSDAPQDPDNCFPHRPAVQRGGVGSNVIVLSNQGRGSFRVSGTYATGERPRSVALGDFDGDGDLDLAVANLDDNTASVFLNDGGDGFSTGSVYLTGRWPSAVTFADVDGDGTCEVLVTGRSRSLSLLFSDRLR